jgi:hypothetical protein
MPDIFFDCGIFMPTGELTVIAAENQEESSLISKVPHLGVHRCSQRLERA